MAACELSVFWFWLQGLYLTGVMERNVMTLSNVSVLVWGLVWYGLSSVCIFSVLSDIDVTGVLLYMQIVSMVSIKHMVASQLNYTTL